MASSTRITTTLLALLGFGAAFAGAQNRGDCRGQQPTTWSLRIADENEPGEPLVVSGAVYDSGGTIALAGHTVFVFQTDHEGYYSVGGMDEAEARLCGLMLTDSEGRYRFETIKPAHYATGGPPAHIHIRVWGPGTRRQSLTLNFEGDPELGERGRDASQNPPWATVRPATLGPDGVLRVLRDLRVRHQD